MSCAARGGRACKECTGTVCTCTLLLEAGLGPTFEWNVACFKNVCGVVCLRVIVLVVNVVNVVIVVTAAATWDFKAAVIR